jgi:uncharacterized membrane protein (UPF0127 family)
MTKRFSGIVLLLALFVALSGGSVLAQSATTPPWRVEVDAAREKVDLVVGEHSLVTELAITSRQQQLGLGYRNHLGWDSAMLFISESPSPKTFWMKGMRMCLDIIWIEGGEIVGAAENTCPDPEGTDDADRLRVSSPGPVTYVLEVNAGWLDAHGYGVGTKVTIPELPAT